MAKNKGQGTRDKGRGTGDKRQSESRAEGADGSGYDRDHHMGGGLLQSAFDADIAHDWCDIPWWPANLGSEST